MTPCTTGTLVGTVSRGRGRGWGTKGEGGPGPVRETQASVSSSTESNDGASHGACPGLGWQSRTWGVDTGPSFMFLLFHSLAAWTLKKLLNLNLSLLTCKMGITVVSPHGRQSAGVRGSEPSFSSSSSPPRPALRSHGSELSHGAFGAQLEGRDH